MNILKKIDFFASSALKGLLNQGGWPSEEELSKEAFRIAGAMLKESEKHEENSVLEVDQKWQKVDKDTKFLEGHGYWIKGITEPLCCSGRMLVSNEYQIEIDINYFIKNGEKFIHIPKP